jgi:hypothetical protein
MLNGDLKEKALSELKNAKNSYDTLTDDLAHESIALFDLRQEISQNLIPKVEGCFSRIANKPLEFEKEFAACKVHFAEFSARVAALERKSADIDATAKGAAGAGAMAGLGVAAFAPSAAMAIATTFGAASTGTAISALSGAAATNAALAWLGGGALAAGGGGMAAGNALLALAGPVGWVIGGVALAGSVAYARHSNEKVAADADDARKKLLAASAELKVALRALQELIELTDTHRRGVRDLLGEVAWFDELDFLKMSDEEKGILIALKNNVESLSKLIQQNIAL